MTVKKKLVELLEETGMVEGKTRCLIIAEDLINYGVTVQRRIPVTERVPEIGDRCLCNVKSFAFPGSFYQSILRYDKYGFMEGCIYTDDVTHWMPMPEPPKEVE